MEEHQPLLGLCPIGKFVFSNDDAIKYKKLLKVKLKQWQIRFIDIDKVLEDVLSRTRVMLIL